MKHLGHKHTKTYVKGHQHCGLCHPDLKNDTKRFRRDEQKEIEKELFEWKVMIDFSRINELKRHNGHDVPLMLKWKDAVEDLCQQLISAPAFEDEEEDQLIEMTVGILRLARRIREIE